MSLAMILRVAYNCDCDLWALLVADSCGCGCCCERVLFWQWLRFSVFALAVACLFGLWGVPCGLRLVAINLVVAAAVIEFAPFGYGCG